MPTSEHAELVCEKLRATQRQPTSDESQGFVYQMTQFREKRIDIATFALCQIDASVNTTPVYPRRRRLCDSTVLGQQPVYCRPAELKTEREALRALVRHKVGRKVTLADMTEQASMCKLKATRPTRGIFDMCARCPGGISEIEETAVARRFDDSQPAWIGGGADAVMPAFIVRFMGTPPDKMTQR